MSYGISPGRDPGRSARSRMWRARLRFALPVVTLSCAGSTEPPVASALAVGTAPNGATSGLSLNVQPAIRVVSGSGQLIAASTASVTASIFAGGGVLQGTTTVVATGGLATFTDLRIDGAGVQTLLFSAVGLDPVAAAGVAVAQVPASVVIERTAAGLYNGVPFEIQPRIEVRDHAGLRLQGGSPSIIVSKVNGNGTLAGTLTASAIAGLATFSDVAVSGSGTHTLSYSLFANPAVNVESLPMEVFSAIKVTDVALGAEHACAISIGGYVYCWGDNVYGKAGQPPMTNGTVPIPRRISGSRTYSAVTAGTQFTCALATDGLAYCWGYNALNQLGGGSTLLVEHVPVAIEGSAAFVSLAAGETHTCALTSAGASLCWGGNAYGELGVGHSNPRIGPGATSGATTFAALDAGGFTTCGLSAGALHCWGANASPATPPANKTPQLEIGGLTLAAVSLGLNHKCGLVATDGWYCWGQNNQYQFGDGTGLASSTPKRINELSSFVSLDGSVSGGCGVTAVGAAHCWGSGRIGDGTMTPRPTPVAVSGGLSFAFVRVGGVVTCGVTMSQELYCWGSNGKSAVGDGTTTNRDVPTRVGSP